MIALVEWWRQRAEREQRLLMLLGALVAAMLVWLAARGLADFVDGSARRHAAAVGQHAAVSAVAAELARADAAPPRLPGGERVADVVAASAAAQGLAFAATQPVAGGGVSVSIAAVRPLFLFGWLAALERDAGVVVGSAVITRNTDATVSADIVFPGAAPQ
jgi:general secretion pathway protein M